MSSYTKFTLATFKTRLTGGAYANLTGANRAIGKTQELSEEDKGKARALAAKHFGAAVPVKKSATKPAAKPAKKVTKKAAPKAKPAAAPAKKAAKKATKKTAKKATKKAAKTAPVAEPAPGASPKAPAVAAPIAPTSTATSLEQPEDHKARVIEQMGSVISTVGQALTSMRDAKQLFPKAELEEGVAIATSSLSRAVQRLDQEVISPGLLPLPGAAAKQLVKAGKRLKTDVAAPVAEAGSVDAAVVDAAAVDTAQDVSKTGRRSARPAQPTT